MFSGKQEIIETINYLSAVLSPGESISADVVTQAVSSRNERQESTIFSRNRAQILFSGKQEIVETINYISAVLSSGESISADVVGKLVKAVGGKFDGIMFGTSTRTTVMEILEHSQHESMLSSTALVHRRSL